MGAARFVHLMGAGMTGEPLRRVVLIGMMGAGKSTVGQQLAVRLGWRYVDNDEDVRAMLSREPHEVHSAAGEEALHVAEASALRAALASAEPVVIAAAAWVILDPECERCLEAEPFVVYLRARPETLLARIGSGEGRRRDATDAAWLTARARERDARYRVFATLTVDVDERSADEVADLIFGRLGATSPP